MRKGLPTGYVGDVDEVLLPHANVATNPARDLLNAGSPLANGIAASITPNDQFTYNPLPEQTRPFIRLPFDKPVPIREIPAQGWTGHYLGLPFDERIEELEKP